MILALTISSVLENVNPVETQVPVASVDDAISFFCEMARSFRDDAAKASTESEAQTADRNADVADRVVSALLKGGLTGRIEDDGFMIAWEIREEVSSGRGRYIN